ncbi:MAG TPA: hypothetical protein P5531_05195 [Bacteroidales bacterium]|nr:hypothetical protein [Bacteroidales bacterium]HSA42600.1 hypothetical protein [Bacteroidales bacterium]
MKKWMLILITLIILGVIAAFLIYKYIYNKPHTDYVKAKTDVSVHAADLFNAYVSDQASADATYTGKVLEVKGAFTRIEQADSLTIVVFVLGEGLFGDEGVRVTLLPAYSDKASQLEPGSEITLKGYCTGFNDTDVVLEKGSLPE